MSEDEIEPINEEEVDAAEEKLAVNPYEANRSSLNVWLVSYSDFMTILTIFFLAMYGYTYIDTARAFPKKADISYSVFAEMLQKLKAETGSDLKVEEDVNKVTIEMNEKILFASGSAKLNVQSENTLRKLAESLNKVEGDVIVQGHTDNVPIRTGRFDSNWELSTARAFSVIEKLTEVGVPAKRLAAWGFGENRPLVSNETAEGQAQNRRIEVVVLKAKAS